MQNKFDEYKTLHNKLIREIFEAKCNYYNNLVTENKNQIDKLWNIVNDLIDIKKTKNRKTFE